MPKEYSHSGCPVEDNYFGDRKTAKKERKEAQAKDRSKYKKTDKQKYYDNLKKEQAEKTLKEELLEGRVLSIVPKGFIVDVEGELVTCLLKGVLKKEKTELKNLVAVGDFVLIEKSGKGEGTIAHILPRKTILSRADNLSRRKQQLIAVNIDTVFITLSVVHPPLKQTIIDRYLIAAVKGGMQPVIVVNKIDLLQEDSEVAEVEREIFPELKKAYEAAGVPFIAVSTVTREGIDGLQSLMKGKASVFSGQSGVGKSSLINAVTGLSLKTGEIVEKTKKGAHTTTTAQLIPLEFGGWCIDTPGIKSFGVWNLKREEIKGYFSDIQAYAKECKFADCTHTHETECGVLQALEEERLSSLRYMSYCSLLDTIDEEHVKR